MKWYITIMENLNRGNFTFVNWLATVRTFVISLSFICEAGMTQSWERSPPTIVARVRRRLGSVLRLCLLFILVLPRSFTPASSVFLPPQKKHNIFKFQFDYDRGGPAWEPVMTDVVSSLNTVKNSGSRRGNHLQTNCQLGRKRRQMLIRYHITPLAQKLNLNLLLPSGSPVCIINWWITRWKIFEL